MSTLAKNYKYIGPYLQYYKVPKGVTQLSINARGSSGSDYGVSGTGGGPATVSGFLSVNPGDVVYISVGEHGQTPNVKPGPYPTAFGGGGLGGPGASAPGNRGGGASDIRYGGSDLAHRVLIAGGGGSAGITGNGGIAGLLSAAAAAGGGTYGGGAGTQSAGGAYIGTGGAVGTTNAGSLGLGGVGGSNTVSYGGGGGGGGLYGGGGGGLAAGTGANSSGGGGGSSWVNTSLITGPPISSTTAKSYGNAIFGFVTVSPIAYGALATPVFPITEQTILLSSPYTFKWVYACVLGDFGSDHSASNFRYRVVGAPAWTTISNASTTTVPNGSAISYSLTATLVAGTRYEWQVQSAGPTAFGAWSASSYFTPSTVPATIPTRPTGGLELELWDGQTGAFITNVPTRIAPSFTEEFGQGAGSFTLRLDDPLATATNLKYKHVVRVKISGLYVGFWVILKLTPTTISTNEYTGRAVMVSGMGGFGAWLPDAVVYPEADPGVDSSLVLYGSENAGSPTKRPFGFMSKDTLGNWRDETFWPHAVYMPNVFDNTAWSGAAGNPWYSMHASWPSTTTAWIAYRNTRADTGQGGDSTYVRRLFSLDVETKLAFFITADNSFVAYLDGEQILTGNDWTKVYVTDLIVIRPGNHILAIEFYNTNAPVASLNPSGLILSAYIIADPTQGFTSPVLVFDTTQPSTPPLELYGAPGIAPAWTTGDILKTLGQEAQDRGVTSWVNFITFGFDEVVDSYGIPWSAYGNVFTFTVGDGYDKVIASLEAAGCDIWFDANFVLQAAPNRGYDRSILYPGDTYAAMVARDGAAMYFPLSTAAGTTAHGTGWMDSLGSGAEFVLNDPSHSTYGVTMGAPSTLTGFSSVSNGGGAVWPGTSTAKSAGFTFEWSAKNATGNPAGEFQAQLSDSIFMSVQDDLDWVILAYAFTGRQSFTLEGLPYVEGANTYERFAKSIQLQSVNACHWVLTGYDDGVRTRLALYRNGSLVGTLIANTGMANLFLEPGIVVDFSGDTALAVTLASLAVYPFEMTPAMITNHYKASLGLLSLVQQPVRFSAGANATESDSALEFRAKTALVVASATQSQEIGTSTSTPYGRIEGFYDGSSNSFEDVVRVAIGSIADLQNASTSANIGISGQDYTAWRDYGVGDWVMSAPDIGSLDTALVRRRVVSITVAEDPATRRLDYAVELDTINQTEAKRLAQWINSITPDGNLGGLIPDPLTGN